MLTRGAGTSNERVPRLFLALESARPGAGGLARVGRLLGRVLAEERAAGRLDAAGVILSDDTPPPDIALPLLACGGRRAAFVWHTWLAAARYGHFVYNFPGVARAHARWPGFRRPFATLILGVDVWEGARADRVRWARRADLLVSISAHTRDRADRAHGGFAHAKVCWLATEEDEPPVRRERSHPPTVLIVGRTDARESYKGHEELIDAWPTVLRAVPPARLVVVGTGSGLERLRARAAALAPRSVEFRGLVREEEMQDVWEAADVFAMPSRGEGFGLVYVEAMRQGIPVVASVHDAGDEINQNGVTGFNVDLDQPGALAARLIELLQDGGLRCRFGAAGQGRWAEHFRYGAFRDRFLGHLWPWLRGEQEARPI